MIIVEIHKNPHEDTISPEQTILGQLLTVKQEWPIRTENNVKQIANFRRGLRDLGIEPNYLEWQKKEDLYNARFGSALISIAMGAYKLDPVGVNPKVDRKTIDFYRKNLYLLNLLKNIWVYSANKTGIITPPPFARIAQYPDPDFEIRKYWNEGNKVDVYSEPRRFPNLFREIEEAIPSGGTLFEFGAAAGDNLVALANHFSVRIGLDALDLDSIVKHPMMKIRNGKDGNKSIEERWKKFKKFKIKFWKGDMFDERYGDLEFFRYFSQPVVFLVLNSVFPHYDAVSISKFLRNILYAEPDYIIIGGAYPGIEQVDPEDLTRWTPFQTARIFQYKTRDVIGFNPKISLVKYVMGRNKEETERWLSERKG